MVTLGNHYNGYLNGNVTANNTLYLAVNYYKYYSKDILMTNSRFMNNNQPINKSLYFNVGIGRANPISNRQSFINNN
jgi:hypothetical protein